MNGVGGHERQGEEVSVKCRILSGSPFLIALSMASSLWIAPSYIRKILSLFGLLILPENVSSMCLRNTGEHLLAYGVASQ
jgi:hypothetical protein